MTDEIVKQGFNTDGVTTVFPTGWTFVNASDLLVYTIGPDDHVLLKELTTDYTVSGGSGSAGSVTMLSAPQDKGQLLIVRKGPPANTKYDYVESTDPDDFVAQTAFQRYDKSAIYHTDATALVWIHGISGGDIPAAGATGNIQYRGSTGYLAAEAAFSYDSTANLLTVDNATLTGALVHGTYDNFTGGSVPSTPAAGSGRLYANTNNAHTQLNWIDEDGIITRIGRDSVIVVRNTSGSTMAKGAVVNITGATGGICDVGLADADNTLTHAEGLMFESVANNNYGLMLTVGQLSNMNTNGLTEGGKIYLSGTAGTYTQSLPTGTQVFQELGTVARAHATQGIIEVSIQASTDPEVVGDAVGAMFVDGTTIDFTYNDGANTITAERAALTGEVTASAGSNATTLDVTAITNRTADASPDSAADYVLTYDASAAALKKVLLSNLPSGGGGTPAGSDKQVQYNATGAFGAEAAFTYDYTTNTLTVPFVSTTELDSSGPVIAVNSTFSGTTHTYGANAGGSLLVTMKSAAGNPRMLSFSTGSSERWRISADGTAESGSDAGTKFTLGAYTDAAALIDTPISIVRAAGGAMTLSRPTTFSSTVAASNLSGTNTGDQTITLTGQVTGTGTGSFAATLDKTAITGQTADASPDATADYVLTYDASATSLKKVLLQNLPLGSTMATQEYTATASQTTFTFSAGYTVGFLEVYRNGVRLRPTTFTATDGSTFVLSTGCDVNDEIFAVGITTFTTLAGQLVTSTARTLTTNTTLTGDNSITVARYFALSTFNLTLAAGADLAIQ